jgi:hypothetical protein
MIKNWIRLASCAVQASYIWKLSVLAERIKSRSGEIEVDNLKRSIPKHSRE